MMVQIAQLNSTDADFQQSLDKLLAFENAQDDAERTMYQDLIHQSLGLDAKGGKGESSSAVKFKDPDGFRKAWNNTKEGATFSFEGKKYRKETPK